MLRSGSPPPPWVCPHRFLFKAHQRVMTEVAINEALAHPNIVELKAYFVKPLTTLEQGGSDLRYTRVDLVESCR